MATVLDQSYTTAPNDEYRVGWDSAVDQVWEAQQIVPSVTASCNRVIFDLYKNGAPSGNLYVEIYSDSSDAPNAQTGEDSGVVAASSLGAGVANIGEITFDFATPVPLVASTKYWLVLKTTASVNADNSVSVGCSATPGYTTGLFARWSGSAWANNSGDSYFKEYYDSTTVATTGFFALL